MKNEIITIYEDGKKKEYKLLMVLQKEYKYIIYTNKDNPHLDKNIFVAKVNNLESINETLPLTEDEWEMLESEYKKIINTKIS